MISESDKMVLGHGLDPGGGFLQGTMVLSGRGGACQIKNLEVD